MVADAVDVNSELLKKAPHLLSKIDKWWILEIEVPTSGEYNADQGIDESIVNSGMSLLLNYFMEVAAGEIMALVKRLVQLLHGLHGVGRFPFDDEQGI